MCVCVCVCVCVRERDWTKEKNVCVCVCVCERDWTKEKKVCKRDWTKEKMGCVCETLDQGEESVYVYVTGPRRVCVCVSVPRNRKRGLFSGLSILFH